MTFEEIIDTIRECYKDDLDNLIMSFYGMGPWRLVDSKKTSSVDEDYWKAMSGKERLLHIKKFFKLVRKKNDTKGQSKNPNTILSTDGKLELPANASDLRKKPGIRNQKRGVRCSTIPRRKSSGKKEEPIEQDLDVYMEPVDGDPNVEPQIDIAMMDESTSSKVSNPSRLAQACDKVKKAANKITKPKRKSKAEKEYEQFLLLAKKYKLPEQDISDPDFKDAPSSSAHGSKMVQPEKPEILSVKRGRGRPRKDIVQSDEPSHHTVKVNNINKGLKNDQDIANPDSKSRVKNRNSDDHISKVESNNNGNEMKVLGEWDVVSPEKSKYDDLMEKRGITKVDQIELEEANKRRREQLEQGMKNR